MRTVSNLVKVSLLLALLTLAALPACAQLNITYGPAGLQTISYRGVLLEDLSASPGDQFHIWHMKQTDLQGHVLTGSSYGWGENNLGKNWDMASRTWTYKFTWGSIAVQFSQQASALNMKVTETNLAGSGVILDGASIYPTVLHFPQLPVGFNDASYPQLAFNTTAPSVTLANFGTGEVAAVVPSATRPLYSGFLPTGGGTSYTPLISSTTPDGLATFQPHNDRPVLPGQTDTFVVSLRFAPAGTAAAQLSADAAASWARNWPAQLHWPDRRAIGTVYLASSPAGNDTSQPGGYPNNPRRYFNDQNASDFDVTNAQGLAAFQTRILQQASSNVQNMRRLGAQGAITWDIEGEQFPQNTSYVCEPDNIAQIAPEMETVVTDTTSPYKGMKLDDAYFKTMTDAGLRVGVCIRPQHFTLAKNGTAQQVYLPDNAVAAELTRKIRFAHDRWGATLFYIDSTVETDGAVLDAGIFQQVASTFPDSLLIPEESTPKYFAYTAPFESYIFHGSLGTDPEVYSYYPSAFSAILVNDADPLTLAKNTAALTRSVKAGDILMAHVDYWQANNPVIVSIYQNAGTTASTPPVSPVAPPDPLPPVTPPPPPAAPVPPAAPTAAVAIVSPQAGASISGAIVVQGAIAANLDAAGSYLMVDGQEIGTARVTAPPFAYKLDTSALAPGTHKLQLWAHDQGNQSLLSAAVDITVLSGLNNSISAAEPETSQTSSGVAILYPLAGQALSSVVEISAAIAKPLDAAGTYLMIDGAEYGTQRLTSPPYLFTLDTSRLPAGQHSLQIWAHDTNNETLLSKLITVSVVGQH